MRFIEFMPILRKSFASGFLVSDDTRQLRAPGTTNVFGTCTTAAPGWVIQRATRPEF
jgi:hypothetical protein